MIRRHFSNKKMEDKKDKRPNIMRIDWDSI